MAAGPLQRRPVRLALAFEGSLALIALAMALVFGLEPWMTMAFDGAALGQSVLATLPLIASVVLLLRTRWAWIEALDRFVREHLVPLFGQARPIDIIAIALMAGIGEELLFRGVIQAGLADYVGPVWALAGASLLFGLAHAMTRAYFVLASLMGAYLGWLYLATGNLLVPMLVHFLYDWILLQRYLSETRRHPTRAG